MIKGGIVPEGYSNNKYPSLLSSGEIIVPVNAITQAKKISEETNNVNKINKTEINKKNIANNTLSTINNNEKALSNIKSTSNIQDINNSISNKKDITKTVSNLKDVDRYVDNVNTTYNNDSKIIQKLPKMAEGGLVPKGYPNDTYPALLTSGETIVPPGKLAETSLKDPIDFEPVEFVIKDNQLVGILKKANTKKSLY
jgi:hypothetical protein